MVVDGGEAHRLCCSTAEYLLEKGKKIEIVTPLLIIGEQLAATGDLIPFYMRVRPKGMVFTTDTVLLEISGNTLVVFNVYTNTIGRIEGVDTVVLATGNRADNQLYRSLKGKVKELRAVGDCVSPRRALEAIYDGYNLGRLI